MIRAVKSSIKADFLIKPKETSSKFSDKFNKIINYIYRNFKIKIDLIISIFKALTLKQKIE